MNHIEGVNRNQIMMTSLDQLVHPEAFVRIIDAFVDAIDLFSFGFDNYIILTNKMLLIERPQMIFQQFSWSMIH